MMGRSPSQRLLAIVAVLGVIDALQAPSVASRNVAPPSAASHQSATQLQAKKASKPAGGGFGAAAPKKPSQKPLKSLVQDALKRWLKWKNDQSADVWISARDSKTWFLAGHVSCSPESSLEGAVQLQKALIFKLGASLDATLEQAPNGLVAALAPYGSKESVAALDTALALVPRDAAVPDDADRAGYEPELYQARQAVLSVTVEV